jgi:hypothetical protein
LSKERTRGGARRLKQGFAGFAPCGFAGLLLAGTAAAPIQAQTPAVDELLKRLEERDAVIKDLTRRVDELERRVAFPAVRSRNTGGRHTAGAVPIVRPVSKPPAPAAPKIADHAEPQGPTVSAGQAPAAGEHKPTNQSQPQETKPAPGQFTVDEEAAERALERTLVATGALLVPLGQAEVQPTFNYTRREQDEPAQVQFGSSISFPTEKVKRDELTGTLNLRGGLPWNSQLEFSLPYNYAQQRQILSLGSLERQTENRSGSAFGDLSVGLAKTVVRESGWRPDVIARFTYDSNTGQKRSNDVALDGGINQVIGEIDLLKRQDPLAFVASGFYSKTFEDDGYKPGDEFGVSMGAFLAASPATSLRFQLQQTFADDFKINHQVVNDSNQVQGLMIIGASSILGQGILLDVSSGIGLTNDAPDYFVQVALPIRFNLPFP